MTEAAPVLLSLGFAAGIWLIYEGLTNPRQPDPSRQRLRVVSDFLQRAGLERVTARAFLGFSIATGLAVMLVAQVLLGWLLVSLLVGLVGAAAPLAYYLHREQRRRSAIQAALVDAIAQLRDGIHAGLSVEEALVALARSGPEALQPEFARLARETRFSGFEGALAGLSERLADPVADVLVAALRLNDRLGGRNVTEVLDKLAQSARAEYQVQQELRAHQARNVLSARIVAAVPLLVLLVLRQVNPTYLAVFDDWWGQLVLAGCLVSVTIGYAGMLWTTRLPGDVRVLAP